MPERYAKNKTMHPSPRRSPSFLQQDHRKQYGQFMILVSLVSNVWLLIQVIDLYQKEDARSLSLAAWILYCAGAFLWFVYGYYVLEKDKPLMLHSSLACALSGVMVAGIVIY